MSKQNSASLLITALLVFLWAGAALFAPNQSLPFQAQLLTYAEHAWTLEEAQASYTDAQAVPLDHTNFSAGFDNQPMWLKLDIDNPNAFRETRYLVVAQSWINSFDLFHSDAVNLIEQLHSRQHSLSDQYLKPGIGYALPITLLPGTNQFYLRIDSRNPIILPLKVMTATDLTALQIEHSYYFGALYGFLLAMLIGYVALFWKLRHQRQLLYALYLACFIVLNFTYTGHITSLLKQLSFNAFDDLIMSLLLLWNISSLLFSRSILKIDHSTPVQRAVIKYLLAGNILGLVLPVLVTSFAKLYLIVCSLVVLTSIATLVIGMTRVRKQRKNADLYLCAHLIAAVGTLITLSSSWGLIPFNLFNYHAIDLGVLMESIIFAVVLSRLVSDQRLATQRALYFANYDALTDLYNRRALKRRTDEVWLQYIGTKTPVSLILIDIDHFKQVNDQYGHLVGDQILSSCASRLKKQITSDYTLARWGGEEFAVLMPNCDLTKAAILAEQLRHTLAADPITVNDQKIAITASFGVAQGCVSATPEQLTEQADKHLYRAKNGGRNRVVTANTAIAA